MANEAALYIWLSYGATFILCGINSIYAYREWRKTCQDLRVI